MTPDPLAAELVATLTERRQSVATAESLTGGLLGAAITSVPGASAVYLGGVISYATAMKAELAGVPASTLATVGPVAAETAVAMAGGTRARTGADWALATTGVAGPEGQDGHQPGEVWVGVAGPDGSHAHRLQLAGDRHRIREQAVTAALALLLRELGAGQEEELDLGSREH